MTREMASCGSRFLFPVVGAFAEMSLEVGALADVTASAHTADQIQFFFTSAVKFMYKQCIRAAWGHEPTGGGPTSCLTAAGTLSYPVVLYQRR